MVMKGKVHICKKQEVGLVYIPGCLIFFCVAFPHPLPSLFNEYRLLVVADISCDVNGSIEFLERTTTIDKPYFTYDPLLKREVSNDVEEYGVTMIGVDILPSELPIESSTHFGNSISQLVNEFVSIASNSVTNTNNTNASTAGEDEEEEKSTIDLSKLSPRLVSSIQRRLSIVKNTVS